MVRFTDRDFGTEMWVAEDRIEEYKAVGHKPAAEVVPAAPAEAPKSAKKKTAKK